MLCAFSRFGPSLDCPWSVSQSRDCATISRLYARSDWLSIEMCNHLEIVRPLWLVVDRNVYEHCSCKQCVLIVFECHGQPHVCCLLILVYKYYTFIESTNNDRSVEVIHGCACRKYHGIADIQGAETGKVCRCDTTFEGPISYSWCTSETLGETEKVQTDGSSCIR